MPDPIRLLEIVLRHPIHIPIVHFPIALSYFSALLAALAILMGWRHNPTMRAFFSQALFFDTGLLVFGVIGAMATGIYENQTRYNGLAPNAQLKIAFGASLLVIAIVLTLWRWRKPDVMETRAAYLVLVACAACAGLATALGFLGGIIVWGA
ncbi:MAG: DUF2231 domain-containing protein [Chloroflexota bacterium]